MNVCVAVCSVVCNVCVAVCSVVCNVCVAVCSVVWAEEVVCVVSTAAVYTQHSTAASSSASAAAVCVRAVRSRHQQNSTELSRTQQNTIDNGGDEEDTAEVMTS